MSNANSKTTLGLEMATDPRWVNIAEKSIEFILTDHAWCEQKAASHGISVISRFSKYPEIVEVISPIVAEEWGHFRRVLKELKKHGFELGHQRKDEYVNKLNAFVRRGDHIDKQLVEYLLAFAMIEARSCERFRLLSIHMTDPDLQKFYHEFMVSEAGHYKAFLNLAKNYADDDYVTNRWSEFVAYEAEMVKTLEFRGDRMH
ncbi:tRNA-(ms[2]io[6]A)-hydroxylase [Bacteroidia bacterium]|nr:tRNA-(ms[2]io[6]A)-hydroxylase [Bacteroidia bacterium]MDB4107355.1 tRNA-(ms[2]io[6]A)-hydroxylase [Bacteroidia bacterium]MDB9883099.1 tRNA-(ms[2]io[6]A)-hydroxylase [Bacteroidia bacterium]MDC1395514.1 tRNA-(ms[2]io[6]A)-hydroxylase [Bacteroidia bacterium]